MDNFVCPHISRVVSLKYIPRMEKLLSQNMLAVCAVHCLVPGRRAVLTFLPGAGGRVPGGPGILALADVSGDAPRYSQRQQFLLLSLFALFFFLFPFVSLLGFLPNSPL